MPRNIRIAAVAATVLTMNSPAPAADGLYLGLTAGLMDNDRRGFDEALNVGLLLGYEFLSVGIGDVALEGLYTTTVDEGDASAGRDWEVDTWGAYGAFRTAGPVYLKAKAGAQYVDVEVGGASDDDIEFSAGLGLGVSFAVGQLEFEYVRIDSDIDFVGAVLNLKTPF